MEYLEVGINSYKGVKLVLRQFKGFNNSSVPENIYNDVRNNIESFNAEYTEFITDAYNNRSKEVEELPF